MTDSTTDSTGPPTEETPFAEEEAIPPEAIPREETDEPVTPPPPDDSATRGKRYQRVKMALSAAEFAGEIALLIVLMVTGASVAIRTEAARLTGNPWLEVLIYLVPFGAIFVSVSATLSAVRTFLVDRRFGLSHQSFGDWLGDLVKAFVVGGILALIACEVLYFLLRRFPDMWWLLAAVVFSLFLVVFAQLAPILVFPLFFKFKRLENEEIVERLERLAERAGTNVKGVYEVDLSRKTRAANAALIGMGQTRRIALADTLLDNFTLDEIEAVLAHEFAHHAHNHLLKAMALQTAMFFLLFFGIDLTLQWVDGDWGLQGPADVANLPLVILAGTILGLILLPVTNSLLRRFERQADEYALDAATRPRALCTALHRLGQLNLADRSPHPLIEWVFYSHPALGTRMERAEAYIEERGLGKDETAEDRD